MITLQIGLQIARETICAGKVLELRATESDGNALKLLRYWIMVVYLTTRLKEVYGGKVRGVEMDQGSARLAAYLQKW